MPVTTRSSERKILLIDTGCCSLNEAIVEEGRSKGIYVEVAYHGNNMKKVSDYVLRKAAGFAAVCIYENKEISKEQVEILKENGNKFILCCSEGFENVPVEACEAAGIQVARVWEKSPPSIAEYAIACVFGLAKNLRNRTALRCDRTNAANISVQELESLLLENKTVGVIGTGIVGQCFAKKMSGLVGEVICYDKFPNNEWIKELPNGRYVNNLDELLANADIISIHMPLLPETRHLINEETLKKMKDRVIIVNTSRGEMVSHGDLLMAIRSGKVGGAAFHAVPPFHPSYNDLRELAAQGNVFLSGYLAFWPTDECP